VLFDTEKKRKVFISNGASLHIGDDKNGKKKNIDFGDSDCSDCVRADISSACRRADNVRPRNKVRLRWGDDTERNGCNV
jgi:hypothetical protein